MFAALIYLMGISTSAPKPPDCDQVFPTEYLDRRARDTAKESLWGWSAATLRHGKECFALALRFIKPLHHLAEA
jgi:hypothetical protein